MNSRARIVPTTYGKFTKMMDLFAGELEKNNA